MRILVVEDDLALSAGLCFELDTSGYLTVAAYNYQKAQKLLKQDHFELVILDVNLPDGNGFDLCREAKTIMPELPVIFLTANDLEQDVLNGFDLGAAIAKNADDCYEDGFLHLDFQSLTAIRNGERLAITPNEYKLLRLLIANAGNIVTRQLLLEKLWDYAGNYIDDHTLTVTMNIILSALAVVSIFLGILWEYIPPAGVRIYILAEGILIFVLTGLWGLGQQRQQSDFANDICDTVDALMDGRAPEGK